MTYASAIPAGADSSAADLDALLSAAATGDRRAFTRFVDATTTPVFRLELARALRRVPASLASTAAETAVRRRYVAAWTRAADHRSSGLSPRAWLLSLDIGDQVA